MADETTRILFIGNSFTTNNDLPGMLASIVKTGVGVDVEHETIAAGGASLRRHWNAGAAKSISAGRWDFVVFQEQSTLPVKNRNRFHENVREFAPVMKESGANMVLYMTWARKSEPQNQKLLTDAYIEIGSELGATVVPAGVAWERLLAEPEAPVLHARDGSHPTVAGTYLAACAFYATLFGGDPTTLDAEVGDLSEEERRPLQRAAKEASES